MLSLIIKAAAREFVRITERKTLYILMIILPLVLAAVLGPIYRNSVLRDIPVAVCDNDNSEISRQIIRSLDAAASLKIISSVNSEQEIKAQFLNGKIYGAFYIPANFEADLKSGKNPVIGIYRNSSNLITSNSIYKDALSTIKTISGGVLLKKLRSQGPGLERAMNTINPIRIETISLFNPSYNYFNFLIPGLLTALLQMIIMVSAVIVISSEFTHNTFSELIELCGNNLFVLIAGKSIPHILIHSATGIGFLCVIFPLFGMEIPQNLPGSLMMVFLLICASFFTGLFISSLFHEQLFATELALFVNTPAFIFSGYTFPLWGMPALHNYFAQIIPFTHFLEGFIKIFYMNAPIKYALTEMIILSVFTLVGVLGTFISLKHQQKLILKSALLQEVQGL